jgi:cardiolipin synthase
VLRPNAGARLDAIIDDKIAGARLMTQQELDARSLPVKLRDGLARLFSPYL